MGPTDVLSQKDEVNTDHNNQEITVLKEKDQDFHIHALDTALA